MGHQRTFEDYSSEEKLNYLENCIAVEAQLASEDTHGQKIEWLRRHIPAYSVDDGENYIFISYSHRDYVKVYNDLAFFLYNNQSKVRFWYDEGLAVGEYWFNDAKKHLENPKCVGVVFYLSENLLRSEAVLREIELVHQLQKRFFTVALDESKYSVESYIAEIEDAHRFNLLKTIFSQNITVSVSTHDSSPNTENMELYSPDYEDALYRIKKIENAFGVTEKVHSNFVFEDVEDGLSLVAYTGKESDLYIPSRIGKKSVVEINAHLTQVSDIYIPDTVKRILPVKLSNYVYSRLNNRFDFQQIRWSAVTANVKENSPMNEWKTPSAIFGSADLLTNINVSKNNPYFFDRDGVLYDQKGTLLRFPPQRAKWPDKLFEGVTKIGIGAFLNNKSDYLPDMIGIFDSPPTIPATVNEIGDYAFTGASYWALDIADGVKKIGEGAFADYSCSTSFIHRSTQ